MDSSLYHAIDIGALRIPGNIFAAPMAGYSDAISRGLAIEAGANLAYTEMISAEALIRGSARTMKMLTRAPGESILAVQLFGSNPESLRVAALIAKRSGAELLDLNAGCPVPKVVNKGAGAALGRDRGRLREIVAAMADSELPVSVKLRSGWDDDEINWEESSHAAVEAGAVALGFHPRTRSRGYGGKADWSLLTALVSEVSVPVVGSGDLDSPEACRAMLDETGCAGVMPARGAVGNPEIYHRTRSLLLSGELPPPESPRRRLEMALRHLTLASEATGKDIACREMKKHLAGYVKSWESAAELRQSLMRSSSYEELRDKVIAAIRKAGSTD